MKKLLLFTLTVLLLLLLAACSKTPDTPVPVDTIPTQSTTAPSDAVTEASIPLYTLKTYSLTDEYGNAGSFSEINKQYHAGDIIELEATVNAGYNFVGWFINNTCVSDDPQFTFTMKSNPVDLEARYDYYTVYTVSQTDDYEQAGTYTILNNKKISIGEQVTVEATVNDGYNFEGWYRDNVCVSEDLSYSFTMKAQNVKLEARWNYYTVTVTALNDEQGTAGTHTQMNSSKVSVGETVTLTATVNNGFNFEGWYVNDNLVSTDLEYCFTMKEQDVHAVPVYSYYTVTVETGSDEQGTAGTYSKMYEKKVSAGEAITLTATVNDGFNFEGWFIDGVCVCSEPSYEFVMDKSSKYISPEYSYYTVTVESWSDEQGTAGTYPHMYEKKVSAGETVTLTATVNDGFNFDGWFIDGVCVSSELTYEFIMDKSYKNIIAEYSYHTLSTFGYINKWGYGESLESIAGTYTQYDAEKISDGEIVTLVATVGDGYTFLGWYINNVCVSTDLEYSYTMTENDVEIEAVFTYYTLSTEARIQYDYWADSFEDSMGTYTKYHENKIRVGETVTLTATTKTGYEFLGWEHGNVIICEDLTYTFVMGTGDELFTAVFAELE